MVLFEVVFFVLVNFAFAIVVALGCAVVLAMIGIYVKFDRSSNQSSLVVASQRVNCAGFSGTS